MTGNDRPEIGAAVFDKDGTLVDFHLTWDPVIEKVLKELASDEVALVGAARAVGFDLDSRSLADDSPVLADSNEVVAGCLAPWFGREDDQQAFLYELEARFAEIIDTTVVGIDGAEQLLVRLQGADIPVGLATNDSESSARRQILNLGWRDLFGSIKGYDSGHGAKPGAGMVIGSAKALGVQPSKVAMVGDSRHDIEAGCAAGTTTIYVGTSPMLGRSADVWINDIAEVGDLVLGHRPN